MNYYAAKFKREAKAAPRDWVIKSMGGNQYRLVFIGVITNGKR